MYHCTDCKERFENPLKIREGDSALCTVSSVRLYCPICKSSYIEEIENEYCRCCGRKLKPFQKEYCSVVCMRTGEKIYKKEKEKYIHIKNSPIYKLIRELKEYNKKHGTNLSYGQYCAIVGG